jgi:transposase InsO family protein
MPVKRACELLGKSRATLHRQRNRRPAPERSEPAARAPHPASLTREEQEALLSVLNSDRFADKSPAQVWAILLDEGIYLASVSSMYRVLRAADQVRERRAQAAHPPRVRPELVADGPDQVRTWDITKLKGPWRGTYFDLYVMIDIFSRKAIHQEVHLTETGELAGEFIENAIIASGGARPGYIHADNGTSMTSKTVTDLLTDLKITKSHSRPHVWNDNPTPKRISRPSSTAPHSPAASPLSVKPGSSAASSSPTTTTSTGTPASACTPPPQSTTAPPGPSGHAASRSSMLPARPAPTGSADGARSRPSCPARLGSTSPAPPPRPRRPHRQNQPPDVSFSLTGSGAASHLP